MFVLFLIAVYKIYRRIYKYVCFDSAGSNGMGQAQSQSSGSGCDECYGNENGYSHGNFADVSFSISKNIQNKFPITVTRLKYSNG